MLNVAQDPNTVTVGSLRDLRSMGDSTLRPFNVLQGDNLGNTSVVVTLPMYEFYRMSAVANETGIQERGADAEGEAIAQRRLDPKHAQKLAVYMLRGLLGALVMKYREEGQPIPSELTRLCESMGKQPYFSLQPIVVNIRTCQNGGANMRCELITAGCVKIFLSDSDVLWVIDGQHRRYGMKLLFEFLEYVTLQHSYPRRSSLYTPPDGAGMSSAELTIWKQVFELSRTRCKVVVEFHLGLSVDQERQLFHDLNNLGKKVEASLAFQFDNSNPVNLFIKDHLIDRHILRCRVADKDVTDWHDDEGVIARKDLIAVNARLFLNKTTVSGAKPHEVQDKVDVACRFWELVGNIPHFGEPGAKKKTVAAQPVVLKALAKLTYDFAFGRERNPDLLERFFESFEEIDFSHEEPMWRFYEIPEDKYTHYGLNGLKDYLPSDKDGANRDIGGFDENEKVMRFGAKHNDIYPILGDMVRWKLGLPARPKRGGGSDVED